MKLLVRLVIVLRASQVLQHRQHWTLTLRTQKTSKFLKHTGERAPNAMFKCIPLSLCEVQVVLHKEAPLGKCKLRPRKLGKKRTAAVLIERQSGGCSTGWFAMFTFLSFTLTCLKKNLMGPFEQVFTKSADRTSNDI